MKFIKMHGIGNDYVYVDCFVEKVSNPPELAQQIAHRRFGVGGDGLILIKPYEQGDGEMEMYNADGSKAEMCGNGIRCVAKYLHDTYKKGQKKLKILTGNGPLDAFVQTDSAGLADKITVDMGPPVFEGLKIPTALDRPKILDEKIKVGEETYHFSSVSMGNPHCVIYVDDVENFPVEKIGPMLENHPVFPARVNVEFVQVVSDTELIQRTWERGSGETWACGTGACAVAVVSQALGKAAAKVTVKLKGGDLLLDYSDGKTVKMTGPAVEVFRGEWPN